MVSLFQGYCESLEDDLCSRGPTTSQNEENVMRLVQEVVWTNHCQTVQTVTEKVRILVDSCSASSLRI